MSKRFSISLPIESSLPSISLQYVIAKESGDDVNGLSNSNLFKNNFFIQARLPNNSNEKPRPK